MSIYQDNGYENRRDYLTQLAAEYGLERSTVFAMASALGHTEDFDGLVSACQDAEAMNAANERNKRPEDDGPDPGRTWYDTRAELS